jgi:hypothetical protein
MTGRCLAEGCLVWACLVCLFGSACGDSVVVAREFSLVSAAVESRDAGSDADEQSDGPRFNFGHGGTGPFGPRTPPPSGAGGSSSKDPHDRSGTGGSSTKSGTPKHP